jgi:hypothetical protein
MVSPSDSDDENKPKTFMQRQKTLKEQRANPAAVYFHENKEEILRQKK